MDLERYFDNYKTPTGTFMISDSDDLFDEILDEIIRESEVFDYSGYLKKDDRIRTLLREKKSKQELPVSPEREFIGSLSFERFSKCTDSQRKEAFEKHCYKKIVAPMLKSFADKIRANGCVWADDMDLSLFYRYFSDKHFLLEKPGAIANRLISSCLGHYDWVPSARIYYHEEDEERYAELPLEEVLNKKKRWTRRYLTNIRMKPLDVIDGTCLAAHAVTVVASRLFHEYMNNRAISEMRDDAVIGELLEHVSRELRARRILTEAGLIMDRDICEEFGYDIADYVGSILDCDVMVRPCVKETALRKRDLAFLYMFIDGIDTGLRSYALYNKLLIAVPFLFSLMRDIDRKKKQDVYRRSLQETAARVFVTKRNIPDKYLAAMKASKLNEVYGFVEIDADCDLERIREIEKEFLGFKQEYFQDLVFKSDAIRFRKLGRHHAAGLYFPQIHCQCVDVRYPDSFIHEYLHMYDYCSDKSGRQLSEKYAFKKILDRYEACLLRWMNEVDEKDPRISVLKGKTKYNLDYYLEPTEVFARCGEMYFRRILGVNCSLLGLCNGFEYPDDKVLMDLIREYYGALFKPNENTEAVYEEKAG